MTTGVAVLGEASVDLVSDEMHACTTLEQMRCQRSVGAVHGSGVVEPTGHDDPLSRKAIVCHAGSPEAGRFKLLPVPEARCRRMSVGMTGANFTS